MCFICNDTKIVYVPAIGEYWNIPVIVNCPICYEEVKDE